MILGMEIALLVMGLHALVTGRMVLGRNRVVYGAAARVLGLIALLPIPLAFCAGVGMGVVMVSRGEDITDESLRWVFVGVEAAIVVFCLILLYSIGLAVAGPPAPLLTSEQLQIEAFKRAHPERFSGKPVPGDAVQGGVPLQTIALAGYGRRPAAQEREGQRPVLSGWAMLLIAVVVGVTAMNAVYCSLRDNFAPGELNLWDDQDRAEPARVKPRPGEPPVRTLPENERPDWPTHYPARLHEALFEPGAPVFLSDLPEFAWKPGAPGWTFGKAGRLGAPGQPQAVLRYNGETPAKGLSMHPPHTGYTRVCYYLGRRAQSLRAKAFLSEDDKRTKPKLTRFVILGDGKVLWRSDSIRKFGEASWCTLNVSQVHVLELRTYVEAGNSTGCHAGWLDPYVVVKK
jgi:hypothetical protein